METAVLENVRSEIIDRPIYDRRAIPPLGLALAEHET